MKVDAHHHLWTISRGDYRWMSPDLKAIYRDFTPPDLSPHLRAAGIEKTVVVQAAETISETKFLLEYAQKTDWIAGVVGWVDMTKNTVIADMETLAKSPFFKGIRPMIQDIPEPDWILRPDLDPVFDALVAMDLTFDALVLPQHLPNLLIRLNKHPDLRCVIDHAAKPDLGGENLDQWRRDMGDLAKNTTCLCKFSGLVTEAGGNYTIDTIRPATDHILSVFDASRLMFGSDWPVLNMAGDYAQWVAMAQSLTASLDDKDAENLWGGTAVEFYKLA